jgi:hypothetical protein
MENSQSMLVDALFHQNATASIFLLATKVEMASRRSLFDPSIEQSILIPCLDSAGEKKFGNCAIATAVACVTVIGLRH